MIRTLVLLMVVAFGLGCEALDIRPRAVGKEGEIVVVTDSASWNGELGDALRTELAPYIGTLPAPERMFELRRLGLVSQRSIDLVKKQKNVIFAAPISDTLSLESRYMRSTLASDALEAVEEGTVAVVGRTDEWAQGQQVYYVIGPDVETIAGAVRANSDGMLHAFNTMTRLRMQRSMFEKGRQFEVEERLMNDHAFAVNAQHDYVVAMDTTNFVWMRRIVSSDSWRSFFVWYTDDLSPADLNPEWALAVRDRLTQAYVQGNLGGYVTVDDRRPLESQNIDFLGRFGYEVRGLWHMVGPDDSGRIVQYGMGGPFVLYAFYDEVSGRTYVMDGMVFAPGFSKREFLRQMEVIAYTFRTENDLNAPASELEPLPAPAAEAPVP
ncbi:MAG: DUF4837 family protein [Rhodothermales bacterium]|nr:DUF4837 family protein [Rhodothermales bacterium]MBO6779660.1 DUF4837 family protein [Rhodothermales bacterium]